MHADEDSAIVTTENQPGNAITLWPGKKEGEA